MVQRQLSDEPTPAATYRPGLPGWCQAILNRALARSPEERFPTAEAFRTTLLAAIIGGSVLYGMVGLPGKEPTGEQCSAGKPVAEKIAPLAKGEVELKVRATGEVIMVPVAEAATRIATILGI